MINDILVSEIVIKQYIVNLVLKSVICSIKSDFCKLKMILVNSKSRLVPSLLEEIINEFYVTQDKFSLFNIMKILWKDLSINLSDCNLSNKVYLTAIDFMFEISKSK